MKAKLTFALFSTIVLIAGCATTNEPPDKDVPAVALSGDELRALVGNIGKTFEGRTSDGFTIRVYNSPDGNLSATARSGGKTYTNTGVWEIKGNEVCNKWDNSEWKGGCRTVTQRGDNFYYTPTTSGIPSTQGKLLDGNPYHL